MTLLVDKKTFVSLRIFELKVQSVLHTGQLDLKIYNFKSASKRKNGFKEQLICFSSHFLFSPHLKIHDLYCTRFLFHIFVQNPISKDATERDALVLLRFLYFMSSCGKWGRSYGMTNTVRQYRRSNVKAP